MIRVLIADDHAAVRAGLRALLEAASDVQVIGEAVDGETAASLAYELHPDVLMLDNSMPRRTGVEVTRLLSELVPDVAVILYSIDPRVRHAALAAGAAAYLPNQATPYQIYDTIRSVAFRRRQALARHAIAWPVAASAARYAGARSLVQILFPLRYGEPFAAPSFALVFLASLGEFDVLGYLSLLSYGRPLGFLAVQEHLLPAAWLVAAAAATTLYLLMRRRASRARFSSGAHGSDG